MEKSSDSPSSPLPSSQQLEQNQGCHQEGVPVIPIYSPVSPADDDREESGDSPLPKYSPEPNGEYYITLFIQ